MIRSPFCVSEHAVGTSLPTGSRMVDQRNRYDSRLRLQKVAARIFPFLSV